DGQVDDIAPQDELPESLEHSSSKMGNRRKAGGRPASYHPGRQADGAEAAGPLVGNIPCDERSASGIPDRTTLARHPHGPRCGFLADSVTRAPQSASGLGAWVIAIGL